MHGSPTGSAGPNYGKTLQIAGSSFSRPASEILRPGAAWLRFFAQPCGSASEGESAKHRRMLWRWCTGDAQRAAFETSWKSAVYRTESRMAWINAMVAGG